MSDDGYYANSPYEDYDDLLYEDNASENLADDLAEHTLPSPIYYEDPAYEMLEYYSDWEYYSDDYYDDDPDLLKMNPQDGKSRGAGKEAPSAKRGKKRKLADTEDIPLLDLNDRPHLPATVKGTVWAAPKSKSPPPYTGGQNERVAFLKDWKKIFKHTSPRSRLNQDESWAENLSLEDMGIRRIDSNPAANQTNVGEEMDINDEDELEPEPENSIEANDRMNGVSPPTDSYVEDDNDSKISEMDVEELKPRKKQRIAPVPIPSPPASHESTVGSTETLVEDMKNTQVSARNGLPLQQPSRGRPKKLVEIAAVSDDTALTNKKKRKASPYVDVPAETTATRSTAGNCAKRVASSRLTSKKPEQEENTPPVPAVRATRSRKK